MGVAGISLIGQYSAGSSSCRQMSVSEYYTVQVTQGIVLGPLWYKCVLTRHENLKGCQYLNTSETCPSLLTALSSGYG